MALNDAGGIQSALRKPRVRGLINGTDQTDGKASFSGGKRLEGIVECDITSNNWYSCDRFNLTLALISGSAYTASWWSNQTDISIILQLGFLADGVAEGDANISWTTIIQGAVDQVAIDEVMGTVQIEGRDLSYLLIESKTEEEFINHTSSQIATILARRHSLTPVVTKTSTPTERYYDNNFTKTVSGTFSRQITEWDLLTFLAQNEGFDLFMHGRALHFQPRATANTNPWIVRYAPASGNVQQRLNVINLHMSRSLILAKDIQVEVRSWDIFNDKTITAIAKKTGVRRVSAISPSKAGDNSGATQNRVYVFPGLSKEQAQKRAEKILMELSQHERIIEYDQPGTLDITPRSRIRLTGTGTSFDQTYYIDRIRRHISFSNGFTQNVRAKNHDAASEILTT